MTKKKKFLDALETKWWKVFNLGENTHLRQFLESIYGTRNFVKESSLFFQSCPKTMLKRTKNKTKQGLLFWLKSIFFFLQWFWKNRLGWVEHTQKKKCQQSCQNEKKKFYSWVRRAKCVLFCCWFVLRRFLDDFGKTMEIVWQSYGFHKCI